jgi:clan AA aspartic protease
LWLNVDAVIDTGFTESLTLSASTIATLGLTRHSTIRAMLADGSFQQFDTHYAEVEWDGGWQVVLVYEAGPEALLGTRLLAGHELKIAMVAGGALEITPIP